STRSTEAANNPRPVPPVSTVCKLLADHYPLSNLGNRRSPLDEYLYILLSLRTHAAGLQMAYRQFKRTFPSWHDAYVSDQSEIAAAITSGGLANQKARYIGDTLRLVKTKFGELSLRRLRGLPQREVESILLELPGVGLKTAKCIMMYSLGLPVLPVDTH